ncbi:DNA repair protein rad16 [Entomophthora muscae]|uniref:DNA repair protein rad16 n=1 Tax=Entomophthora muscae TaxID=34485 RepID=A0ACC2TML8_9FUNG|nr:DNA repair protein rad16 [Entomophthora muscae]
MNHFCWWNADILKPIQNFGNTGEGEVAFQKLGKLLDRIMLRRTKVQKADDLGLPPRVVTVRRDVFNEEEEDMYTSLYTDSKRKFTSYVAEGTVLNHYANIFELITKMRLAVNHPDLILKRIPTATNNQLALGAEPLQSRLICAICQDEAEDPIASKCKHVFCREDVRQFLDTSIELSPKCPSCFVPLTIDLSQPTMLPEDDDKEIVKAIQTSSSGDIQAGGETFRGSIVNRINLNTWRSSTKIEALVEELDKLRSQDHTIKSIVFSQFVNFLDLVYWRLTRAGFACCRLDGRMSPAQRDAIIKTFMQRHEFTVFLISLKAGGIALNLTEASRVFLCDPWWNPAVEDQAMDRIHRLGQRRPIKITRLVVENSIESRILQLQAKKHALFESTIGKDTTALARLTEEDLKFLFVL